MLHNCLVVVVVVHSTDNSVTATGGVHGAKEWKEEEHMTGRRRRCSIKELVEKIEREVAAENSSRKRLMSDRK